jgi:C4-type Zn-finger protein
MTLNHMSILLDSPRSINKYNVSIHKNDVEVACPSCGKRMKKHGKYKRWVHSKNQSFHIFVLRRRCGSCDRTHALLPCFLTP